MEKPQSDGEDNPVAVVASQEVEQHDVRDEEQEEEEERDAAYDEDGDDLDIHEEIEKFYTWSLTAPGQRFLKMVGVQRQVFDYILAEEFDSQATLEDYTSRYYTDYTSWFTFGQFNMGDIAGIGVHYDGTPSLHRYWVASAMYVLGKHCAQLDSASRTHSDSCINMQTITFAGMSNLLVGVLSSVPGIMQVCMIVDAKYYREKRISARYVVDQLHVLNDMGMKHVFSVKVAINAPSYDHAEALGMVAVAIACPQVTMLSFDLSSLSSATNSQVEEIFGLVVECIRRHGSCLNVLVFAKVPTLLSASAWAMVMSAVEHHVSALNGLYVDVPAEGQHETAFKRALLRHAATLRMLCMRCVNVSNWIQSDIFAKFPKLGMLLLNVHDLNMHARGHNCLGDYLYPMAKDARRSSKLRSSERVMQCLARTRLKHLACPSEDSRVVAKALQDGVNDLRRAAARDARSAFVALHAGRKRGHRVNAFLTDRIRAKVMQYVASDASPPLPFVFKLD